MRRRYRAFVGGLPKVDHEFHVMEGELHTAEADGHTGLREFSVDKLLDEHPEYFVFNGAAGALTKEHPPHAKTGEPVSIFFGVGGPNFTHAIRIQSLLRRHDTTDPAGLLARLAAFEWSCPRFRRRFVVRWQQFTGKHAMLDGDGRTFEEIARARRREVA